MTFLCCSIFILAVCLQDFVSCLIKSSPHQNDSKRLLSEWQWLAAQSQQYRYLFACVLGTCELLNLDYLSHWLFKELNSCDTLPAHKSASWFILYNCKLCLCAFWLAVRDLSSSMKVVTRFSAVAQPQNNLITRCGAAFSYSKEPQNSNICNPATAYGKDLNFLRLIMAEPWGRQKKPGCCLTFTSTSWGSSHRTC